MHNLIYYLIYLNIYQNIDSLLSKKHPKLINTFDRF